MFHERTREDWRISDDPALLDVDATWAFLRDSYWATDLARDEVERRIAGSLSLGLYRHREQVVFARVIGDRASFAYLADVFILETFRGKGVGKWLVQVALDHPDLATVRRWLLATRDGHGLYARFGFVPLVQPSGFMEWRVSR